MTSLPSWAPSLRPPALDILSKYGIGLPSNLDSVLAAGALSPDVQPNSPPSFAAHQPIAPAASSSLLMIGNYVLTERLPDMSPGIAVYKAVHVVLREEFLCRILPLDRCHSSLTPFYTVGPHPHINGVHEVVMGATSAYVMHRAASTASCAEDLHAYVRRRRRLPELEASRLFAQALKAVAHCHRSGVVVRDIKLRRFVFCDAQRTTLQLDGLYDAVVFQDGDDRLTDKHGCLAYVSPEILDATFTSGSSTVTETATSSQTPLTWPSAPGRYAGRAADMWSLGVMLYTMLVGRYPFADMDACALFARIRRGRYPLPSEISLSAQARCLIRSLLAVSPLDRITAEEALRHPWFAAAKVGSEPLDPAPFASTVASDDRVVPEAMEEGRDEFFVE